jgi:hypothetical protein
MDELVQFLRDRLNEDEQTARDELCVNCGNPIVPLRSALGITGYSHGGGRVNEHGEWERNWEGRRCPGSITGAEAVQNPARVLRDIEARRALLAEYVLADAESAYPDWMGGYASGLEYAVRLDAARYADHPEYNPDWAPVSQWEPPTAR